MSGSLGIPVKLLHEVAGYIVTVELKSGQVYRGSMIECEDKWNSQLQNITFTDKDGKVTQLEHVFIRGNKVRFMIIPDMIKNAPMFKRLEARIKGKGSALGVGRGRAAQAAGRETAGPGRGRLSRGGLRVSVKLPEAQFSAVNPSSYLNVDIPLIFNPWITTLSSIHVGATNQGAGEGHIGMDMTTFSDTLAASR
ncbi:small nuclear ribonucleoprotein SmD3b [Artemisia annua]|uniref:Small nuclear ribonucleoprotein Sm D3 n=1 Tax=Artemisia annua TaxID=35608 RepID=A0A2U1MTT2_ARTAN|nr:small nuclear ribonucleoprotein SmD3b [Artemisia annua]